MTELRVYGAQWCSFCKKTKDFLETKGVDFTFVDIDQEVEQSKLLLYKNLKTIPQVFKGGTLIGGYKDTVKHINNT